MLQILIIYNKSKEIQIHIQKGNNMSEVKWTKEQEQAIYEKGSNILVAAAAREW